MRYPVLLVDYGEVVSEPQAPGDVDALAALAGVDVVAFLAPYWRGRTAYDLGLPAADYWAAIVAGGADERRITALEDADHVSWSRHRPAVVAVLEEAREQGARLVLLSNAPLGFARRFRHEPLAALFDALVFSAEVGAVKPDAVIYRHALAAAGVSSPAEAYFVDDRPVNVEAARALGIAADVYSGAEDLRVAVGLSA